MLTFVMIVVSISACGKNDSNISNTSIDSVIDNEEDAENKNAIDTAEEESKKEVKSEIKESEPAKANSDVPREYKGALKSAESYLSFTNMSKLGLYSQLVSEHGAGFPKTAAQYAIDNIQANWKEQALGSARTYADIMNMSNSAIYDQLVSEYGGNFTEEEAQYAIDNLD